MARRTSVLVVAKVTAASPQLIEALQGKASGGELHATLLMPCVGVGPAAKEETRARLDEALAQWRDAGLTDVEGIVGDQEPMVAVHETWDPLRYDEVVVSTLPGHASEWLRWDLPHRIARATDAHVTHVMSSPPPAEPRWEPPPPKERSPLGPLSVGAWGRTRR